VQTAGEKPEVRNGTLGVVSGCCPLTLYECHYSGLDWCSFLGTWLQRVQCVLACNWKNAECFEPAELVLKPQLKLCEEG
jgi:hypothetical protein